MIERKEKDTKKCSHPHGSWGEPAIVKLAGAADSMRLVARRASQLGVNQDGGSHKIRSAIQTYVEPLGAAIRKWPLMATSTNQTPSLLPNFPSSLTVNTGFSVARVAAT